MPKFDKDGNKIKSKAGRKAGWIHNCPHTTKKHFAKGMCNHCYHRFGRQGYATNCKHSERMSYAKGKCQNCYINDYNKAKRARLSKMDVVRLNEPNIIYSTPKEIQAIEIEMKETHGLQQK